VETSIDSVAKYIVSKETDPVLRVKALHDYVADRIAYDAESYFAGVYPPQDAETVFRTRKSVCAGYAQLLEALGKAAGVEIV
jgi:transglutaminase-like putative cysteine protease